MSDSLVIFLHGVGARGADLLALGDAWREALPDTRFAAPDGPAPFDMGGPGRQWFSVSGVTEANRAGRIAAARPAFDAVIEGVLRAEGFEGRLDRVAFVGFSQGSIMALDALATGRWAPRAVLAYSGRLATPDPLSPRPGAQALLIHGGADRLIPSDESRAAERRLVAAGVDARALIEPGLAHGISGYGAARGADFLSQAFGG